MVALKNIILCKIYVTLHSTTTNFCFANRLSKRHMYYNIVIWFSFRNRYMLCSVLVFGLIQKSSLITYNDPRGKN